MLRLNLAFLLLPLLVSGVARGQAGTDVELAKAHYRTGEIYYERGRYPDAAREFEEAYRLSNRPELLYNMGKSYDGAGDAARALTAYRRFLGAVKASPDRGAVEARITALTRMVGHINVHASVEEAAVKIDGEAIGNAPLEGLELNPGPHAIEVSKEGFATWRSSVMVRSAMEETVEAEPKSLVKVIRVEVPQKVDKPVYKKWWFWTTLVGAVAVAGGVTAAVLLTQNSDGCSGACVQLPAVRPVTMTP
jgi:tetratricopeptide (TPR) repeat protein